MSELRPFPPQLRRFVELFNEARFWDGHEALEDEWRAKKSDFYHGLILYASAFVHVQRDNRHGILAQLDKATRRLAPYGPSYLGIDVERLLLHARTARACAERGDPVPLIQLELDPALSSGTEPEIRNE